MRDGTLADLEATVAAFNEGDRDAITRWLGRDYFNHVPPAGEPGADTVLGPLVSDLARGFPDLKMWRQPYAGSVSRCA